MNRVALNRRAEEALRRDLQPGERIAVGSAVASDPSRWGAAVLLPVALALTAAGLATCWACWARCLPVPSSH